MLFRGNGSAHRVAPTQVTWEVPECWCGFTCPFRGSNYVQKHMICLLQQFNLQWPMLRIKTMWLPRRVSTPHLFFFYSKHEHKKGWIFKKSQITGARTMMQNISVLLFSQDTSAEKKINSISQFAILVSQGQNLCSSQRHLWKHHHFFLYLT